MKINISIFTTPLTLKTCLSDDILRLKAAHDDLLRLGAHEGDCTFDDICPTCNRPNGICIHHSNAMIRRQAAMTAAVLKLCSHVSE